MKRYLWPAAIVLLAAFDVYCFAFQWSAVAGNTAASIIWTTPALATHHVLTRRRQDRQHRERVGRQEAQAAELAAHRQEFAAVAAKVTELHDFHLHMKLPDREL